MSRTPANAEQIEHQTGTGLGPVVVGFDNSEPAAEALVYAAAAALSRGVLTGETEARERYLDILRSGNSRYPVETLQLGGVDMTTAQPIVDVVTLFASLMDEVEQLLEED